VGQDSSFGRVTRYGWTVPVRKRFSALDPDPGAQTTLYKIATGSLFPAVKWPGRDVDHPPPASAEVKERVELNLYSSCGPSWPVLG
jgi:hypothetical protein